VCALHCVCLKGYHIHIRSTSHNQKLAEAKKQKQLAKGQLAETVAGPQSSSKPAVVDTSAPSEPPSGKPGPSTGVKPLMLIETSQMSILKSANNQSAADTKSSVEKPPRGPNYCDVCCFEFSSAEV